MTLPVQEVYEERIRAPHGLDLWLGLPEAEEARFQPMRPMAPTPEQQALLDANRTSAEGPLPVAFNRAADPSFDIVDCANSRTVRALGPAPGGGVGTARGLEPDHFTLGFETEGVRYPALGATAFGHSGAAGSEAFADPRTGLTYGYTRRRFAFPGGAAPENQRLVAAVARAADPTPQRTNSPCTKPCSRSPSRTNRANSVAPRTDVCVLSRFSL